jgi:hypothetical protein
MQMRERIGKLAPVWQAHPEEIVAAPVQGYPLPGRESLSAALHRADCGAVDVAPEFHTHGVRRAPGLLPAFDLFVARGIVPGQNAVRTDAAHVAERQRAGLALVAIEPRHFSGDVVGLILRNACLIESRPLVGLALLAREPCKHARFDPGEIRGMEAMAGAAEIVARVMSPISGQSVRKCSMSPVATASIAVPRSATTGRLRFCSWTPWLAPPAGTGAMVLERAADAAVAIAPRQHGFEFVRAGVRPV